MLEVMLKWLCPPANPAIPSSAWVAKGAGQEGFLLPQLKFVWQGDILGLLERALTCICHHGREKKLQEKGGAEDLYVLVKKGNNTSVAFLGVEFYTE